MIGPLLCRSLRLSLVSVALLATSAVGGPAFAGAGGRNDPPESRESCAIEIEHLAPTYRLERAAASFSLLKSLVVVVFGSTSSTGRGVSSPARSFSAALERGLSQALGAKVVVINRAQADLTAEDAASRLNRYIFPLHPALVIWEAGTTDAIRGVDLRDFGEALRGGAQALFDQGIDVVFMDAQYSPQTATMYNFEPYLAHLHRIAEASNAIVFPRWELMQGYIEDGRFDPSATGVTEQFRNADFLHGCIGRLLSGQIVQAMKPPPR